MRLLNFKLFIIFFTKRFCMRKKAQKSTKNTKSTKKHKKAQKRNQAKAQNANKPTKIKNALKKHLTGKKVTYSLICVFVFYVHAKKRKQKTEKNEKSLRWNLLPY